MLEHFKRILEPKRITNRPLGGFVIPLKKYILRRNARRAFHWRMSKGRVAEGDNAFFKTTLSFIFFLGSL